MHICFVYPGFSPETHAGGIGTYIKEITTIFKKNNIDVTVVSRSDKFFNIHEVIDGIDVYRIGESKDAIKEQRKLFRFDGYEDYYKKVLNTIKSIDSKKYIDLIEVCDWGAEGYYLDEYLDRLVVRCHTPSFVSESYNPANYPYFSDCIKEKEKELISKAKNLFSPSESLIDEIKKYTNILGNVIIEPYSMNVEEFSIKKNYKLSNPIKILTVGRIEERKGQDIIIKAVDRLISMGYEINFDLIGSDTQSANFEVRMSDIFIENIRSKAKDSIKFLGEKKRKLVLNKYKRYDIYVAASRYDNYPFTVLESMGSGLPVIANNNSGMKEQIIHDKDGLLFDGTVEGLVLSLIRLINSKELRRKIGFNSVKKVHTLCSTNRILMSIKKIVNN